MPGPHDAQLDRPAAAAKAPAAQGRHALAPIAAEKSPAPHASQLDVPDDAWPYEGWGRGGERLLPRYANRKTTIKNGSSIT